MGRIDEPWVQVFVRRMTAWQRNQWARDGYPVSEADLRFAVTRMKPTCGLAAALALRSLVQPSVP